MYFVKKNNNPLKNVTELTHTASKKVNYSHFVAEKFLRPTLLPLIAAFSMEINEAAVSMVIGRLYFLRSLRQNGNYIHRDKTKPL